MGRKCEKHGYLENVLISRAGARSAAWGSVLSCSWVLCWRSWAALGPYVGGLVPLLGLCWRSWAALGAYVVGLEPLLDPMLAVLRRSWGLSGRSGALCSRPLGWARRARSEGPDRSEGPVRIFSVDMYV